MDLHGKTTIVTGGGTGLGKAISLKMAAAGAAVAVNYPGADEDEAKETVSEICASGGEALSVRADVSVSGDVTSMVEQVVESYGGVDILVNNAGVTVVVPFSDLDGVQESDWDHLFAVNVKGAFLCTRAVAHYMKRRTAGVVVNITSRSAIRPAGSSIPYSVSKAAGQMLTKCLAQALAPDIRVNSVVPGGLMTRWGMRFGEEVLKRRAKELPLRKHPEIGDVADAVMFLISNESMTGESIVVDSGWLVQ